MGMIVAGADFGSNKTGYIVAEAKGGELVQLERESRFTRLAHALLRERHVAPTREAVLAVPLTLPVADQDDLVHRV